MLQEQSNQANSNTNDNDPTLLIDDTGNRIVFGENKAMREPATHKGRFDLISPFMLERLAKRLELGANKYADRNWEKGGIPYSRYVDSTLRHINQYIKGQDNEDHLAAAIFNIMALIHMEAMGNEEDNDLPNYLDKHNKE